MARGAARERRRATRGLLDANLSSSHRALGSVCSGSAAPSTDSLSGWKTNASRRV